MSRDDESVDKFFKCRNKLSGGFVLIKPEEFVSELPGDVKRLRKDKQAFLDKLHSGALESTPARLSLASHIINYPDCQCDICETDAQVAVENERI